MSTHRSTHVRVRRRPRKYPRTPPARPPRLSTPEAPPRSEREWNDELVFQGGARAFEESAERGDEPETTPF